MKLMLKHAIATIVLVLSFAAPVLAGPLEDASVAYAAYHRGDYATALRLWLPLANQGDAVAQYNLGLMYERGYGVPQNYVEAMKWYRKAADRGHPTAKFNLGVTYDLGLGVPQNYAEALKWYRLAAEQGHTAALFNLGLMYLNGHGVPQNDAEAMKWFRKAADKGHTAAQYSLGVMYDLGRGVPQNYAEAVKWYRLAADHGYVQAQHNLGLMYFNGHGVPQDYVSAHIWFNLASAGGDQNAVKGRNEVEKSMTRAQIAEAQRRVAQWQPKTANASPNGGKPTGPASKGANLQRSFGTAFFVSKEGTALTNSHVVEQCNEIRVGLGRQESTARILARDEKNDLALLTTSIKPALWATWRFLLRQGDDVVVYGFPLTGLLASGGNVVTGNVTALSGVANDSRFLQISAPVQPGNSGGPLLDRSGNVVGVVVAKLDALNVAMATGDIPQNVNFAIKGSVAAAFLDSQQVAHTEGEGTAALSTPDISERAKTFTAQVVCIP